jgi:DNA polymerase III subunit epsilon
VDHHRALCDAKAAAELLNLMNRRREEAIPSALEDAA